MVSFDNPITGTAAISSLHPASFRCGGIGWWPRPGVRKILWEFFPFMYRFGFKDGVSRYRIWRALRILYCWYRGHPCSPSGLLTPICYIGT